MRSVANTTNTGTSSTGDTACLPGTTTLPVITGISVTAQKTCAPGSLDLTVQTDQNCQLTAEQQDALRQRLETLYQQLLTKALLDQAVQKSASTALTQALNNQTGQQKSFSDHLGNLLRNGTLNAADLAAAHATALQHLQEQAGTDAGTSCQSAGSGQDTKQPSYNAADSNPAPQQQLEDVEKQADAEGWASLSPTEFGQKIADTIRNWVSGRTQALCELISRAHLTQEAAAEAADSAAQMFGGTGDTVTMGDYVVIPPSAPGTPTRALAVDSSGTVTIVWIDRTWNSATLSFDNTNLRPFGN
ncbi:hypothetical protein RKE32_34840 [Streptomyces sp. Li-HN-5-13]|nr:hypothetical protein RKE32_34840 [Streptomyces sp. Li-HN-5-13]